MNNLVFIQTRIWQLYTLALPVVVVYLIHRFRGKGQTNLWYLNVVAGMFAALTAITLSGVPYYLGWEFGFSLSPDGWFHSFVVVGLFQEGLKFFFLRSAVAFRSYLADAPRTIWDRLLPAVWISAVFGVIETFVQSPDPWMGKPDTFFYPLYVTSLLMSLIHMGDGIIMGTLYGMAETGDRQRRRLLWLAVLVPALSRGFLQTIFNLDDFLVAIILLNLQTVFICAAVIPSLRAAQAEAVSLQKVEEATAAPSPIEVLQARRKERSRT